MNYWLLLLLVTLLALVLTGLLRRYALASSLLDVPNARSSHSVPTPRGGGVAIVLSFLFGLPLLGGSSAGLYEALYGAGLGVALIGFLDDRRHIAAHWRLIGHFSAAFWVLFWLNGLPALSLWGHEFSLGWFGYPLGALYLVWLLNLYNFMDGIDGLASLEAISVCLGGALLHFLSGDGLVALTLLLLAASVTGFLFWNFPTARIFMGDSGSGFLGIALGIFSLHAVWQSQQLLWSWLILLGVFIVDATWTLLCRLLRGKKIYQAHRSHAYQRAVRLYGGHRPVSLAILAINVFWLFPLALIVGVGGGDGLVGVIIAWAPLLVLAIRYRAGMADEGLS